MPRLAVTPVIEAVVTPQPIDQSKFQPTSLPENDLPEALIRAVKACIALGMSDSKIIKEILGYQGGDYQKGKALFERLKQ
jgi:hypothetical protein